jgi:hypothetical protein
MNEPEKITNAQNIEEQEQLKAKYEAEKTALEQENLSLQNKITKKNDEIFELQKTNKNATTEKPKPTATDASNKKKNKPNNKTTS